MTSMRAPRPAATTLVVCIATTGRAAVLTEALREVCRQTRRPDRILVCPVKPGDVEAETVAALPLPVEMVTATASGLAAQRNALLAAAADAALVLFIDDDFLLAPDYLAELEALFAARPDCMIATGTLLADGAQNMGFSPGDGRAMIAARPAASATLAPVFNAYGCNMALRWSALRGHCLFDEALPLYAWQEDVDFSRQAARRGAVLKSGALVGVHLAAKHGRVSGLRLGYSQIANQFYLARKGTLPVSRCLRKVAENVGANLLGAVRGHEPFIDRRGRLAGNLLGIRDILTGHSSPGRVLSF